MKKKEQSMYLHDDMRGEPNLAKRIQSVTSHKNFLFGDFPQSMFLNLATQEEIVDIACTSPAAKSAGYDNIPMHVYYKTIYWQHFLSTNSHYKSLYYPRYRSR